MTERTQQSLVYFPVAILKHIKNHPVHRIGVLSQKIRHGLHRDLRRFLIREMELPC